MGRVQYTKPRESNRIRDLDIWAPFRYARGRVYSIAVRVHYQVFFARHIGADPTGSGRAAAMAFMQARKLRPKDGVALSLPTPLCDSASDIACDLPCEVVGGLGDCTCIGLEEFKARLDARLAGYPDVPQHFGYPRGLKPAPFTGTPYDPDSEED